jgi:hypothetical protein
MRVFMQLALFAMLVLVTACGTHQHDRERQDTMDLGGSGCAGASSMPWST